MSSASIAAWTTYGPRAASNTLRRTAELGAVNGGRVTQRTVKYSLLSQAFVLLAIAALIWFLASNTIANLRARGIATGFGFLWRVTSLPIPNSWLAYSAGVSSY